MIHQRFPADGPLSFWLDYRYLFSMQFMLLRYSLL